ncbi:MAG: glycosyltransferase family 2 protein [Pseudomonadota bacterium]
MASDIDILAEQPLLSVVIPNFNHGKYLERCVAGHLVGRHRPLEIILVDDHSTDDSVAVASAICARHDLVRLLKRTERGGPNIAVCDGLAAAQGKYVSFAAADDSVEPDFASSAISTLEEHPQAALCFYDPSSFMDGTGQKIQVPLALSDGPAFFSPDAFEAILKRNYFTISSNTVVYRTDAIREIGGFRAELALYADWMANLVLAFRHGACYRPEAKAHFRISPGSYSGSKGRSAAREYDLLFKYLDVLKADYSDVRARFRNAGAIPEMRLRGGYWLAADRRGREMLTGRLFLRLVLREIWTHLRPLTPQKVRSAMRALSAARSVARRP